MIRYKCIHCGQDKKFDDMYVLNTNGGAAVCLACYYTPVTRLEEKSMKNYVAGFLFSDQPYPAGRQIALILKDHPEWQRGKFNGIGGKIESGERPIEAIRREFKEEASLDIDSWVEVVRLYGADWTVHFYRAFGDVTKVKAGEKEKIEIFNVNQLPSNIIPNLSWLIPLSLDLAIKVPLLIPEKDA